jgi:hypothetical protein
MHQFNNILNTYHGVITNVPTPQYSTPLETATVAMYQYLEKHSADPHKQLPSLYDWLHYMMASQELSEDVHAWSNPVHALYLLSLVPLETSRVVNVTRYFVKEFHGSLALVVAAILKGLQWRPSTANGMLLFILHKLYLAAKIYQLTLDKYVCLGSLLITPDDASAEDIVTSLFKDTAFNFLYPFGGKEKDFTPEEMASVEHLPISERMQDLVDILAYRFPQMDIANVERMYGDRNPFVSKFFRKLHKLGGEWPAPQLGRLRGIPRPNAAKLAKLVTKLQDRLPVKIRITGKSQTVKNRELHSMKTDNARYRRAREHRLGKGKDVISGTAEIDDLFQRASISGAGAGAGAGDMINSDGEA